MAKRITFAVASALAVAAISPAGAAGAEALYGITSTNHLLTFGSGSPGALSNAVPITGLQPGENLVGVDVRPKTGQLYALGSTSRLYVLSPTSGAATAIGQPFSPPLAGSSFGFDVNPAADRIRLVSDGRQNLRLNPDEGVVAGQDGQLAYAEGDPAAGTNPSTGAAAYAADAQLFVVDTARDQLDLQSPPNEGKLTTVGPLGVDVQEPASLDISSDGRAWLAARRAGAGQELFSVDLKTGRVGPAAAFPAIAQRYGEIRGIAAAGPVPDDKARAVVLVAYDRLQAKKVLGRGVRSTVSCSETCGVVARLTSGQRLLGEAVGMVDGPGKVALNLRVTPAARRAAKAKRATRAVLSVVVTDAAGNKTRLKRAIRFE